ncbi:monoamine oxidase [Leptolyngbya sp. PCC 7375]|nr:monoamine oxidase [Leptolyngbya sp. PCC 7375]
MEDHTPIEQQLDQIQREDKNRPCKEILVLGAGMAGLAAGYELAQLGHQVKIIEASGRLGGRVWTHRFENGQYGELGAMRIPGSHDYTRHYVSQLKLRLRSFINFNPKTYRDFEGTLCRAEDAPKEIGSLFNLSGDDRKAIQSDDCKAIQSSDGLDAIYLRIIKIVLSNLEDSEKSQLFGHGPFSDRLTRLDRQSLLHTLRQYAETADAVRLMGKATVLDDYWQRSTLLFIREEIDKAFTDLEEIEGGMGCLPEKLADASLPDGTTLRDHIAFSQEVYSIAQGSEGITVAFKENGKLDSVTSPYVLCTIPFSVLRRIKLQGLCGSKRIQDAIQGLGYQSATKVLVNCKQRFWESKEEIYGGASLSDSIARMTFYPSDNAEKKDQSISEKPGVLLGSYTWGATARRLGVLSQEARGQLVIEQIKRFHPDIKDYLDLDQPYVSMAWDQNRYAAGAFSSSYPQDLQMFFPGASQPAGRLFFAGEHLSPYPTWIQGGLWSALQAVMQIVVAC